MYANVRVCVISSARRGPMTPIPEGGKSTENGKINVECER